MSRASATRWTWCTATRRCTCPRSRPEARHGPMRAGREARSYNRAMSSGRKQRVVVGLSGGVDSAVSAHLLKQQGHEVVAIFMKNWEDDDDDEYCSSRQDFLDAASVADVLGIEIEHVNFAAEYKDRVFARSEERRVGKEGTYRWSTKRHNYINY